MKIWRGMWNFSPRLRRIRLWWHREQECHTSCRDISWSHQMTVLYHQMVPQVRKYRLPSVFYFAWSGTRIVVLCGNACMSVCNLVQAIMIVQHYGFLVSNKEVFRAGLTHSIAVRCYICHLKIGCSCSGICYLSMYPFRRCRLGQTWLWTGRIICF
jgi:hypothetical protein